MSWHLGSAARLVYNALSHVRTSRIAQRSCAGVVLLAAAAHAADSRPSGQWRAYDGAATVPILGGERVTWTQAASSVSELRALTHRLYVDDFPVNLPDVRCAESAQAAAYECTAALPSMTPGRHRLELTSILDGAESQRSTPLIVDLVPVVSSAVTARATPQPGAAEAPACFEPDDCYVVGVLAAGAGVATIAASSPAGLLLVESMNRVRVVADGALLSEPVLEFADPAVRIVGIAVDPEFRLTRAVFVVWTDVSRTGARQLHVTRYRDVGHTLGEGATIVTGLPFPEDGTLAPAIVGEDGLFYMLLPAALPESRGVVVRFQIDGRVPEGQARSSPVIAETYARPTALAVDTESQCAVLGGRHASEEHSLSILDLERGEMRSWSAIAGSPSIALSRSRDVDGSARVLVSGNGRILGGVISGEGAVSALQPLRFDGFRAVSALAAGPDGSWFVLTSADGAWTVWKLEAVVPVDY